MDKFTEVMLAQTGLIAMIGKAERGPMGIEAIKSSTPAPCREAFEQLFQILINGTEQETQQFIQNFRNTFDSLPAEEKAFPRGVSSLKKYIDKKTIYAKGTPINSRAAILYNHRLKELGLENKYEAIKEGEKIKYIHVNPRNPMREDVIGFSQILPPEFGIANHWPILQRLPWWHCQLKTIQQHSN
jgi:hypothetical protein